MACSSAIVSLAIHKMAGPSENCLWFGFLDGVYIFYNRNDLLNLDFDINFDLFLFDTTVCSMLTKFLQPNDQYCKHTGGKFFYLCPSQEKANLFLYFVLTD